MNFHQYIITFVLLVVTSFVTSDNYNIGFLLNDDTLSHVIEDTRDEINRNASVLSLRHHKINTTWYNLSSIPVQATKDICEYLIANQVYIVITTNAMNSTQSPDIVSYACAFYKIPTIAVEARDTELSDTVSMCSHSENFIS